MQVVNEKLGSAAKSAMGPIGSRCTGHTSSSPCSSRQSRGISQFMAQLLRVAGDATAGWRSVQAKALTVRMVPRLQLHPSRRPHLQRHLSLPPPAESSSTVEARSCLNAVFHIGTARLLRDIADG